MQQLAGHRWVTSSRLPDCQCWSFTCHNIFGTLYCHVTPWSPVHSVWSAFTSLVPSQCFVANEMPCGRKQMRTVQTRCFLWIFKTLKYELFEELAEIVLSKSHKSHHHSTSCIVLLNSGFPHKIFVCFSNFFSWQCPCRFPTRPRLKTCGLF